MLQNTKYLDTIVNLHFFVYLYYGRPWKGEPTHWYNIQRVDMWLDITISYSSLLILYFFLSKNYKHKKPDPFKPK